MASTGSYRGGREYLLSHHTPDRFSRTFAVPWRGGSVHLCARCTGQFIGFVAYLVLFYGSSSFQSLALAPITLVVAALLPLPAALDWITQSTGARESGNRVRLVTGVALGAAVADLLTLLLTARVELFLGGLLILAAYLAGVLLSLKVSGAWRRVIHEHFPDVEVPPTP